jgi:uncharacterized protein (DUF924 family)
VLVMTQQAQTKETSPNNTTAPAWVQDILTFWFHELTPQDWFSGGERVDNLIRERFAALHQELAASLPDHALDNPKTALACVILFDQFPRNLYRGTAKAFASDDLALSIARHALARGFDEGMTVHERMFLYLPFEHSEVLADGELSVSLFENLGDETGLAYAIEHRDILARFGRYPHRNEVLGRSSSEEERAFLAVHQGFGQ